MWLFKNVYQDEESFQDNEDYFVKHFKKDKNPLLFSVWILKKQVFLCTCNFKIEKENET